MHVSHLRACACVAILGLACLAGAAAPASAAPIGTFATVVSGLDNPRDLAFSPNGQLFVAEAGHGGSPSDCVSGGPGGGLSCPGFTSGISVVDVALGQSQRVVSGLASVSDAGGFGAIGIDGISFHGSGGLYGIIGESSESVPEGAFSADIAAGLKAQLGRLIKVSPSGHWKVVADVGHSDYQWTADHQFLVPDQFPESNPYGVLAVSGSEWVVDAAANTLDQVGANGEVRVAAFFPNPAVSDAVPTCVDQGPDGALYIGELTGAGNAPGSSNVWRFAAGDSEPTIWASGLTAVTGCGFGADGQFYATEFSTLGLINAAPGTGMVVRVPAHSTSPTTVASGLSFPGGFAAGPDGSLYVSNWSTAPTSSGLGAVVRITSGADPTNAGAVNGNAGADNGNAGADHGNSGAAPDQAPSPSSSTTGASPGKSGSAPGHNK